MNIEWLGPLPRTNYTPGRNGQAIDRIVNHWTVGTMESAIAHFRNPGAGVSAHFIVGRTGRIVQLVAFEDSAYHAGDWPMNLRSIGIEHEGQPGLEFTEVQYAASAWLHRHIAAHTQVVLASGVLRHRDVVATQCPGPLDVERIIREAQEEDEMTPEEREAEFIALTKKHITPTLDTMKRVYDPLVNHIHDTSKPKGG